jgi:hypothetical protein
VAAWSRYVFILFYEKNEIAMNFLLSLSEKGSMGKGALPKKQ